MKLLVIRHAVAQDREDYQNEARGEDVGIRDDNLRPLTIEGIRKMRKNADGLSNFIGRPTMLVSSPLTRALQTTEILQENWIGLEMTYSEALRPDAKPSEFVSWFESSARVSSETDLDADILIAIVGHEPHLSKLVSWLLDGAKQPFIELKKGGACLIEFRDDVLAKGGGTLLWHATPAILRHLR